MSDLIKIDTAQVAAIADSLDGLNNNLQEKLTEAQKAVASLESVWSGEAANATIEAVNSFATDYFQSYKDLIDQYVQFLRKNVAEGYTTVETTNTTLADSFK